MRAGAENGRMLHKGKALGCVVVRIALELYVKRYCLLKGPMLISLIGRYHPILKPTYLGFHRQLAVQFHY